MKTLYKTITALALVGLLSPVLSYGATVFNSNQIASSTPTPGYVIVSNGNNTAASWVATSSLGFSGGATVVGDCVSSPCFTGTSGSNLIFTGSSTPSYVQGRLIYDTGNESLTFYNNDSNIGLQLGQEEWIRVKNVTGSTIANGAAVYINGSNSGLPTIALAQSNLASTTVGMGLATESIANNGTGYVTSMGVVHNIDTSAFTAGLAVYLSSTTPGALTQTAPAAPYYRYRVGIVAVSSSTAGAIHVTPSTASIGNGTANQVFGMNTSGTGQELKTLLGTANRITATGGANTITYDISPSYVGQASITTLGTIGTGTWGGTPIAVLFGGTGTSTAPSFGQLLMGNGSGGYNLVATSSLGITGGGSASTTWLINPGFLRTATSTDGAWAAYFTATSTTATSTFAGAVGVGTSTPFSGLDVFGNFRVGTGTRPMLLANTATGKVSIGTTTTSSTYRTYLDGGAFTDSRIALDITDSPGYGVRSLSSMSLGYGSSVGAGMEMYDFTDPIDSRGGNFGFIYGGVNDGYIDFVANNSGFIHTASLSRAGNLMLCGIAAGKRAASALEFDCTNPSITTISNNNLNILPNGTGKVGIGTSTPQASLSVQSTAGTVTSVSVASSTGANLFSVNKGAEIITGGGTPTTTSCGTSPVVSGNDQTGTITTGSGSSASSCTIVFSTPKLNSYTVTALTYDSVNRAYIVSKTSTSTTIGFTSNMPSTNFDYQILSR